MAKITAELVGQVVATTLEEAAFCFVEPVQSSSLLGLEQLAFYTKFSGDAQGELLLVADTEVGEELASNLLGLDPGEADKDSAKAALSEILNMFAGPLITRAFGDDVRCEIQPPEEKPFDNIKSFEAQFSLVAHLESEEGNGLDVFVNEAATEG